MSRAGRKSPTQPPSHWLDTRSGFTLAMRKQMIITMRSRRETDDVRNGGSVHKVYLEIVGGLKAFTMRFSSRAPWEALSLGRPALGGPRGRA